MTVGGWYMEPNLKEGDYVFLDTKPGTYTYGDIVLFYYEGEEEWYKYYDFLRVAGLPGDKIYVEDDFCIINGKKNVYQKISDEPVLYMNYSFDMYQEVFPNDIEVVILHSSFIKEKFHIKDTLLIPSNHYFLLGDVRTGISDSRIFGPLPIESLKGKVVTIKKGSYNKAFFDFHLYALFGIGK